VFLAHYEYLPIAKHVNQDAANMMQAAVTFDVTRIRPLLDMGGYS